jgi:hypothetical protein
MFRRVEVYGGWLPFAKAWTPFFRTIDFGQRTPSAVN